MKKILLSFLVLMIVSFIFIPKTYALNYYNSVNIKTAFSEDINLESINWIEVHLEDSTEYSKEYFLEKDKNFTLNLENVPVGPYNFRYGVVNDDQIGYYKVSADIVINEEANIVDVTILVTLQNNQTYENSSLNNDNTSNTTTNDSSPVVDDEDSEVIIGEEDEKDKNEEKDKSQTNEDDEVLSDYIKQEREKEEQAIKKILNRKKK